MIAPLGVRNHDGAALGALLLDRRERSLAGAIELASRSVGLFDVNMAEQVELEARLDDLARYDRLVESFGAPATEAASPYQRNGRHSFFVDLATSGHGDADARLRIDAHRNCVARERRTNLGAHVAGQGGEFVAPRWLLDDAIEIARPRRSFLDAVGGRPLPSNAVNIYIPSVTGGTTAAARTTDINNPSSSSITTSNSHAELIEVAAKVTASLQILDLSPAGMDSLIHGELVSAVESEADRLALVGSGSSGQPLGLFSAGTGSTTFSGTTASQFITKVSAAASAASVARGLSASHVVWHPRRRAWLASVATADTRAGMEILNTQFVDDGNVATTLGAGTNEDAAAVFIASDLRLWEAEPTVTVATSSSSGNTLEVVIVVRKRFAFLTRYPAAVNIVSGTGLNLLAT